MIQSFLNYKVIREIGRGAKGVVYLVEKDGKKFALKTLLRDDSQGYLDSLVRFRQESSALSRLSHPGIVAVRETGEHEGAPFIVMEFLDAEDLKSRLKKGVLPQALAIDVALQIAQALNEIHRLKMVHRDIKPENIIFTSQQAVKLIDFGLVSEVGVNVESSDNSAVVGTLIYSSPEQAGVVRHAVDETSDLYSLGIVLWEMLLGKTPFDALDHGALMQMKANVDIGNIHSQDSKQSFALGQIIAKLLARNPAERYQSAKGLIGDLKNLKNFEESHKIGAKYTLGTMDRTLTLKDGPLVGRRSTLDSMLALWKKAQGGSGNLILLEAGAGVGKTRLVTEVMREVSKTGATVLGAQCNRVDSIALAPILDLLKIHFSKVLILPEAERHQVLGHYRKLSANTLSVLASVSEEFATALEIPIEKGKAHLTQEVFIQHVIQLFAQIASLKSGLFLAIENAQWLDESSVEFIKRLGRELPNMRASLLFTIRNDDDQAEAAKAFKTAASNLQVETFQIAPLTRDEAKEMIEGLLGGVSVSAAIVEKIAVPANFNPFAIREFLLALVDSAVITVRDQAAILDEARLSEVDLSSDAYQLIEKRVKSLVASDRDMLSMAAVLGVRFDSEMLAIILGVSEQNATLILERAIENRLVEIFDKTIYSFAHERVRDAFLALFSKDDLVKANRRAAQYLENIGNKSPEQINSLANHYMQMDTHADLAQALLAFHRAGQMAMEAYSHKRAYAILSFAYNLIPSNADPVGISFDCIELYGVACIHGGHYTESAIAFDRLLPFVKDRLVRGRLLYWKVKVEIGQGKVEAGWALLLESLRVLGKPYPTNSFLNILSILKFIALDLFLMKFPITLNRYPKSQPEFTEKRKTIELICKILETGANAAFMRSKPLDYVHTGIRANVYARELGPSPELAMAMAQTSAVYSNFGFDKIVESKYQTAMTIAREMRDESVEAYANFYFVLSLAFRGQMVRYNETVKNYFPVAEKLLPYWQLGTLYFAHTSVVGQRGDYREIADFAFKKLYIIDETKNLAWMTDFRLTFAGRLALLGRSEEAHKMREEAKIYFDQIKDANINSNKFRSAMEIITAVEKGEIFDDCLEPSLETWAKFVDRSFFIVAVYVYSALLRSLQYALSESATDKSRYLAHLRIAVKVLKKRAKTPLYICSARVMEAGIARIDRRFARAEKLLNEADVFSARALSSNGAFWSFYERARLARDQGNSHRAGVEIRAAFDFAEKRGWVTRMAIIEREFGQLRAAPVEKAQEPDKAVNELSMERAMSALLEISAAASKSIDPVAQGRSTLDTVIRLLGAERSCIFLGQDSSSLSYFLGRTASGEDIAEMKGFSTTVVRKVFEDRRAVIITGTDQGEAIGSKSIVAHNLKSIMVVPLVLMEDIKGVVYLDSSITKGLFSDADLDLLVAISTQIAASIHISELAVAESDRQVMKKDLELSASVQKMFLPEVIDINSGDFNLSGFYRPATQCGGDWWWYKFEKGTLSVVVGDVTGHGAAPAMITASIASSFRIHEKELAGGVKDQMIAAHGQLYAMARTEYAMTMFGCEVDCSSRKVKFWSACAPQAFVLRKNEEETQYLSAKGGLLGMQNFFLDDGEYTAKDGDRLFIFSDGIVEMKMTDGRVVGERRLNKMMKSLRDVEPQIAKVRLVEELDKLRGAEPQEDDFTFVIVDL